MARFVRDVSYPDSSIVRSGQTFEKTWMVRNDGDVAWDGASLSFASGDEMQPFFAGVPSSVLPGHEVPLSVTLTAPTQEGRYVAYFRLKQGEQCFGQRFWCDIRVSAGATGGSASATEADVDVSAAIAEAIGSVICDETTPHEALGKLLRTWTMVNPTADCGAGAGAGAGAPPAAANPLHHHGEKVSSEEEPAVGMPPAPATVPDNVTGDEDSWQSLWAPEVTLLEAMGFDSFGDVLPILQKFLTPLALAPNDADTEAQIDPEGFQKVVNALLAIRNRDQEAMAANSYTSSSF
jgi:hypothetical protein